MPATKKKTMSTPATEPKPTKAKISIKKTNLRLAIISIIGVLAGVLLMIAIDGFVQWYQIFKAKAEAEQTGSVVAALVNGEEIYVDDIKNYLFNMYGQQQLEAMIVDELWFQKAKQEGITLDNITTDEMNAVLEEDAAQYGGIEEMKTLAEASGVSFSEIERQAKIVALKRKLAGKDLSVSDEELAAFFETQAEYGYTQEEIEEYFEGTEGVREYLLTAKIDTEITTISQTLSDEATTENFLKDKDKIEIPKYEVLKTYKTMWNKIVEFFKAD
ncbi:hypothetical protein JW962_04225 [Candidatus Dojkabacteria bacterium]|nr:hypothetical protein [Candidatus Dojkabacteria bacterium]